MAFDPISAALDLGGKVVDHFFPDPVKNAEAKLELVKLQQSGDLAIVGYQNDVNRAEATNPNLFIAGWRPFIGWICGVGLGWQFLIGPLLEWGSAQAGHPTPAPKLDTSTLTSLLIGMLGLGGMRTVEKLSNAQGNH